MASAAMRRHPVSRNDPRDWHLEGNNVWATAEPTFTDLVSPADVSASRRRVYTEGGAEALS